MYPHSPGTQTGRSSLVQRSRSGTSSSPDPECPHSLLFLNMDPHTVPTCVGVERNLVPSGPSFGWLPQLWDPCHTRPRGRERAGRQDCESQRTKCVCSSWNRSIKLKTTLPPPTPPHTHTPGLKSIFTCSIPAGSEQLRPLRLWSGVSGSGVLVEGGSGSAARAASGAGGEGFPENMRADGARPRLQLLVWRWKEEKERREGACGRSKCTCALTRSPPSPTPQQPTVDQGDPGKSSSAPVSRHFPSLNVPSAERGREPATLVTGLGAVARERCPHQEMPPGKGSAAASESGPPPPLPAPLSLLLLLLLGSAAGPRPRPASSRRWGAGSGQSRERSRSADAAT